MMSDGRNEAIKNTVEKAFEPLRCVAEIWDYGQKLRFKVFDQSDNVVLGGEDIVVRHLSNDADLKTLVESYREQLRRKGLVLDNGREGTHTLSRHMAAKPSLSICSEGFS